MSEATVALEKELKELDSQIESLTQTRAIRREALKLLGGGRKKARKAKKPEAASFLVGVKETATAEARKTESEGELQAVIDVAEWCSHTARPVRTSEILEGTTLSKALVSYAVQVLCARGTLKRLGQGRSTCYLPEGVEFDKAAQ